MNLLAFLLLVAAATVAFTLAGFVLMSFLDGRDARRDAARRNGAHRR